MTDENPNHGVERNQNVNWICQTAPHLAQKSLSMEN